MRTGEIMSNEQKDKISKSRKGFVVSEKTKRKISIANKGKKLSKEHIEKIKKNNARYWGGKKHSEEYKKQHSISAKKSGVGLWMKGRKMSTESKRKNSESHKGDKSPLWKGGITAENRKIRGGLLYREWRENVYKRDNYICNKCLKKCSKGVCLFLHPHHILNFSSNLELRFTTDNGITFCRECHKLFHHIYGVKNNTQEQVNEFIGI